MTALNLGDFTTVVDDDFTKDKSLNTSIWTDHWGNPDQYWFTGTSAGLLISGSQSANWNPVGIEQAPTGKSAGEGYGLYSFTGYAGQAGQGVGICFVLWPADNVWLPSDKPGQASEIDILESWDGSKSGDSTIHYYDASVSGDNGQSIHNLGTGINITTSHTYAIDWERGSLTYYVDGQEIYQDTTHVPLDAADGGVNETMGAEVVNEASYVTTPTVQLYIQDISYSKPNPAGAAPPPPAPPPPTPPATPPPTPPAPTIALAALGSAQEASSGAGVTLTETVSATNLTTLYAEVLTASGAVESGWQTVTLNASGQGSFSVHLAQSGDFVEAVDNTAKPSVTGKSAAITINDPVAVVTPPPVSASGVLGQSAAGPLAFSVLDTGSGSTQELELDVDKAIGAAATLREYVDGTYIGTLRDHLADGSYTIGIAALAAGTHTIKLTLDGSADTATASFVVPSAAIPPAPPTTGTTGGSSSAGSAILLGQSPGGPLSFSAVATAGGIDLDVTKTIGKVATLREFIDKKYIGTLRDHLADGSYTIATPALAAGTHTIELTLDGSAATATASFKISAATIQASQAADFASTAQLDTTLTSKAIAGSAGPVLPELAAGAGAQLLATVAGSVTPATLLLAGSAAT